jgi:hypothetical protein
MGDSYAGSGSPGGDFRDGKGGDTYLRRYNRKGSGLKPKDLCGMPWKLALALQADGWYLRSDTIWCLSGATRVYAKTQKGEMPMTIKDIVRLDPKTVKLWNGKKWTQCLGWNESPRSESPIEIELRSGEKIGCTPDHKFPTQRGLLKAKELITGDVLESCRLPEISRKHPLGYKLKIKLSVSKIEGKEYPSFRGEIRFKESDHRNFKDMNEIVRIGRSNARKFWDIGVEDEPHLFALASGVLTHNSKPNPMPESTNGWRWERHRIKVKKSQHAEDHNIKGGHKKMLEDPSCHKGMSPKFLAKYTECPGCKKCEPNDGLVLRKAAWRPTKSKEYLFMLTKSDKYYGDAIAVREVANYDGRKDTVMKGSPKYTNGFSPSDNNVQSLVRGHERWANRTEKGERGRNLRDVWTIPIKGYPGAHFATFPPDLVSPCIKAGTSSKGCCPDCGAGWARIVKNNFVIQNDVTPENAVRKRDKFNASYNWHKFPRGSNFPETLGWKPVCKCGNSETVPAIVLDPFFGSGTTGEVALKLGRNYIGIDLSEEYIKLADERLNRGFL